MCYLLNRTISGADDEQTFLNFQCYPDRATLDFIVVVVKHLGKIGHICLFHAVRFFFNSGFAERKIEKLKQIILTSYFEHYQPDEIMQTFQPHLLQY